MSLTLVTGLIGIVSLVLKYLNYRANSLQGVAKAQAIGASDEVDLRLATKKDMTPEEMRDNETIAANAHKIILE